MRKTLPVVSVELAAFIGLRKADRFRVPSHNVKFAKLPSISGAARISGAKNQAARASHRPDRAASTEASHPRSRSAALCRCV